MKTITFLFLASLLVINNPFDQTAQESPELKEATALTHSALKLFSEKKYDESLSRVKKALEIREPLLPRTDARIVNSLIYLGDIYLVKRNYGEAKKFSSDCLRSLRSDRVRNMSVLRRRWID